MEPDGHTYDGAAMEMLEFHRSMVLDRVRVDAFARAIEATVRADDVVLDLGTGTGLLACIAARCGARRVIAVEQGDVAALAREVVALNGFADRVEVVSRLSTEVELDEPADVIVSETIGNMGFDEGIVRWIDDARSRLARDECRVVPQHVATVVTVVDIPVDYEFVSEWEGRHHELDLAPMRRAAASTPLWLDLSPAHVAAEPAVCLEHDLRVKSGPLVGRVDLPIRRDGVAHGIGAWFTAELATGIDVSNAPPTAVPSWSHVVLPIADPRPITRGDRATIELEAAADGLRWRWRFAVNGVEIGAGETYGAPPAAIGASGPPSPGR